MSLEQNRFIAHDSQEPGESRAPCVCMYIYHIYITPFMNIYIYIYTRVNKPFIHSHSIPYPIIYRKSNPDQWQWSQSCWDGQPHLTPEKEVPWQRGVSEALRPLQRHQASIAITESVEKSAKQAKEGKGAHASHPRLMFLLLLLWDDSFSSGKHSFVFFGGGSLFRDIFSFGGGGESSGKDSFWGGFPRDKPNGSEMYPGREKMDTCG